MRPRAVKSSSGCTKCASAFYTGSWALLTHEQRGFEFLGHMYTTKDNTHTNIGIHIVNILRIFIALGLVSCETCKLCALALSLALVLWFYYTHRAKAATMCSLYDGLGLFVMQRWDFKQRKVCWHDTFFIWTDYTVSLQRKNLVGMGRTGIMQQSVNCSVEKAWKHANFSQVLIVGYK